MSKIKDRAIADANRVTKNGGMPLLADFDYDFDPTPYNPLPPECLLYGHEVKAMTGLSDPAIDELMALGKFPSVSDCETGLRAWDSQEVTAWLKSSETWVERPF